VWQCLPNSTQKLYVIGKTGIFVSKLAKQIYASIILKRTNEKLPIIFRRSLYGISVE
jgi:hypothetical protein